MLLTIIIKTL